MSRAVAILQSNYIPWKGYFDLIAMVDEFIILDEVQYTKNDWRNRNQIKTQAGTQWLTIPVSRGKLDESILSKEIASDRWAKDHWKSIRQSYSRAPGFEVFGERLEQEYAREPERSLSAVNLRFIRMACELLGIETEITSSTDYELVGDRNERLVGLCTQAGATSYLSGPAARAYLDEAAFGDAGIEVQWMDYSGYPEYPQVHGAFEHGVSVVDLLLNAGTDARSYLKSGRA